MIVALKVALAATFLSPPRLAAGTTAADDNAQAPRAVVAWPAGPLDVRIAFDRPIEPASITDIAGRFITFGTHPSHQGRLRIVAARLEDNGRTLDLSTDPHPWDTVYSCPLDGLRGARSNKPAATTHIDYNLSGAEVVHESEDGEALESLWWPHVDPAVVARIASGSVAHERSLARLRQPGRVAIRALIATPEGSATCRLDTTQPLKIEEATLDGEPATLDDPPRHATLVHEGTGDPAELWIVLKSEASAPMAPLTLRPTWASDTDLTPRFLDVSQLRVLWAPARPPAAGEPPAPPASLSRGNAERGEAVFFSEESKCATCHSFRGRGGHVGPDLTNISERGAAAIYRDIAEPSAIINSDYVPYTVVVKDGRVLAGIVRLDSDGTLRVIDTDAKETDIPRADLEELRPSATSIMPVGLSGALGGQELADLIAFLTQASIKE